jgi:hypothetical protein
MSGVRAGRLLMLILNVINPASSFETTTVVMSGAFASSPVESVNVCEFPFAAELLARAAVGTATTAAASTTTMPSLRALPRFI